MSELEAIKARAEAATPGPWEWTQLSTQPRQELHGPGEGVLRTSVLAHPEHRNAEFIARARTDIPKLVEALEAVLELSRRRQAFGYPISPNEIQHVIGEALSE